MTPAEYIDFDAVMPYPCSDNDTGCVEETKDMPPNMPTDTAEDMPADTIRNAPKIPAGGDAPEVSEEHAIDETPEPKKRRYFCSIS